MTNSYNALLTQDPTTNHDRPLPAAVQSGKRKRGEESAESTPVVFHVESLTKICTISRARLPLSYLEPIAIQHRRFRARIPELEYNNGRCPNLCIVQDVQGKLFAVEKVCGNEYALCQLADRVTADALRALQAEPVDSSNDDSMNLGHAQKEEWWRTAALPVPGSLTSRKAPRLSIRKAEVDRLDATLFADTIPKTRTYSTSAAIGTDADIRPTSNNSQPMHADTTIITDDQPAHRAQNEAIIDETFASFITSYLDMLYKSKTSVAYFAKAHTARLKAQIATNTAAGVQQLIDLLGGLILSSSVADKKHKNVWPSMVRDHVPTTSLTPEQPQIHAVMKKSRPRKVKVKADKRGLLPGEESYFFDWWVNGEDSLSSGESVEARLKRRSVGLRTREAFLQIILMLEIAVLRTSSADDRKTDSPGQHKGPEGKRKHKAHSETAGLDIMLDKLCIWHSIESSMGASDHANDKGTSSKAPDQLRNFCIEVIVPFYISKLPDLAGNANKKLGGPSALSSSTSNKRKDEQKSRESASRRRREPLQRVPSEQQPQKSKHIPTLPRSATDSQLSNGVKREGSQTSLDAVPLYTVAVPQSRKSSVLDKMKMQRREVDFEAMSQAQEARRKKQAEVDSKLKEAISALKRPNRHLAGRELADVAEQRELMAQARDKAARASQKSRQKSQVQVDATPKHNRIRPDMVATTPEARRTQTGAHVQTSPAAIRVPFSGQHLDVPATANRDRHLAINATPTKHAKNSFAVPAVPESIIRPSMGAVRNVMETPIKQRPADAGGEQTQPLGVDQSVEAVFTTPVKALLPRAEVPETPGVDAVDDHMDGVVANGVGEAEAADIYAALGWND